MGMENARYLLISLFHEFFEVPSYSFSVHENVILSLKSNLNFSACLKMCHKFKRNHRTMYLFYELACDVLTHVVSL